MNVNHIEWPVGVKRTERSIGVDYLASMAWTMWCLYGLDCLCFLFWYIYAFFCDTSMGHFAWYLFPCNELSLTQISFKAFFEAFFGSCWKLG
jgi:hypothetical protein